MAEVDLVDASYGGLGIVLPVEEWRPFEETMELQTQVTLGSSPITLHVMVRWVSDQEPNVRVGLELMQAPQSAWRAWIDLLKGETPPEENLFNL